jgi:hypothetical protein
LRSGRHVLKADVRLKIPAYQQRRYPNRFKKVSYQKKLKFPFKTCPPGTA